VIVDQAAFVAVFLAAVYFIALGGFALAMPERTKAFLGTFATSLRVHVVELALRAAVGAALVLTARRMWFTEIFLAFGWLILGTTLLLALVPWRQHRRFAAWSVPRATRFLPAIGVGSLGGGILLLGALLVPRAAS
jgi:hypothetical protein